MKQIEIIIINTSAISIFTCVITHLYNVLVLSFLAL